MNSERRYHLAAAYHEAGHAVARVHVGAPATDTWITEDGRGMSEGTGLLWAASGGQYAAWDLVLVCLAGARAEARYTRRAIVVVTLSTGFEDYNQAKEAIGWLVDNGYADDKRAAWARAEQEVRQFMRERWSAITTVARALGVSGRVSAAELQVMFDENQEQGS